jgi:hypothetical protein
LNDEELGMAVSRMAAALPEARTTRSTA